MLLNNDYRFNAHMEEWEVRSEAGRWVASTSLEGMTEAEGIATINRYGNNVTVHEYVYNGFEDTDVKGFYGM